MGFTNPEQLRDVFLCGGMGFLLGLYYDGFRLFRLFVRPPRWAVFLQDVCYCVTAAVVIFLFALAVTDGQLRLFLPVGLLVGFLAYRQTVGRVLLWCGAWIRRRIKRLAGRLAAKRAARKISEKNHRKKAKKFQKSLETDGASIV